MWVSRQFGGWSEIMKRKILVSVMLIASALSGFAFADNDGGGDKYGRYNGYDNTGFVRDQNSDRYENNADGNHGDVRYDTARVLSVDPIIDEYYQQSRRECWVEPNSQYANYRYNQQDGYRGNANNDYSNNLNQNRHSSGNGNTNAIIGGILGGVLGHQVGKGDGRKVATIAGAVLGYAIAREVSKDNNRYRDDSRYNSYGDDNGGYRNDEIGYQTSPSGNLRCRMVNDERYDYGYQSNGYRDGRDSDDRNRYVNERYQDRYNHDRYDNRYDNARVTGYRVTFRYHDQTYTTVTDYHPGSTIRVRVNVTADNRDEGYAQY
jgi:uncharacterized protein YcfJ